MTATSNAPTRGAGAAAELQMENERLRNELAELHRSIDRRVHDERLKAAAQLARGLVHDFNNTLTPILSASDFILSRPSMLDQKEELQTLLQGIRTGARRAREMMQSLREFYRVDDRVTPIALDVGETVRDVVESFRKERQDTLVAVKIALAVEADTVPQLTMALEHLRALLTHLLQNAVEALPNGGEVKVVVRLHGDRVRIEMQDNGEGMKDEVRLRCLEPFFTTRGRKRRGLGLSRVYGIVKHYGGAIEIRSAEGHGTTIEIDLPVSPPAPDDVMPPVRSSALS